MTTYWETRIEKLNNETYKDADKYVRELRKLYEQEINNIEEKIYNHLSKLQEEAGGISLFEAKKLLNDKELGFFKMDLDDFIKKSQGNISPELEKELNIISRRVRISRLQAMEVELKKTVAGLMSREEKGLFAHLGRTYERRYYKELYELQRITGYESVRKISKEDLKIILNNPWTSDGREFSERIWGRGDKLVNSLKDNLTRNIARGASPEESIKEIQKQFGVSKAAASRLVYTETSAISSFAVKDSYIKMGVKKYEILATLDLITSDICRQQDGKKYDVKDYMPGITANPFHPNCRTTTIPCFDDDLERRLDNSVGRMARDPVTGKSVRVGNLTYKEWYNKYVKDNPEAIFKEKSWKNRHADKDQFAKYRNVLGKDLKNNFKDFQETKYKDEDKYRLIKIDYKRRKKLIDNPNLILPNVDEATIDDRKFTEYLFGGTNKDGLIKGRLINNKLGYNINNYKEFAKEILIRAKKYPAKLKSTGKYGSKYETRTIFYGKNGEPVNVEIGWLVNGDKTHLTSIYINEVNKGDFKD